jgi:hypothetical protein
MGATLKTEGGRPTITVYYDPVRCDWDEAIRAALAAHGFKSGQVKVIALPAPAKNSEGGAL